MTLSLNSKACNGNMPVVQALKFKVQASAGRIMCTIFWDAEGVLLITFMPHKVTATRFYQTGLLHKLLVTIKEKHQG